MRVLEAGEISSQSTKCMQDGMVIKVYCIGGFKETAQYGRNGSLVHNGRLKLDQYAVVK